MSDWDSFLQGIKTQADSLVRLPGAGPVVTRSCRADLEHAANVIEWAIEPRFLNTPQIIKKYHRQYQILRDAFQLRCPICNSTRPEAIDCWGKTQMELESEVLLRWREDYQDEVCPKCANTKLGLIEDGMLEFVDTVAGIAGMRCLSKALVPTDGGLRTIEELYASAGGSHKVDEFVPLRDVRVWDGTRFTPATHVYYAGEAATYRVYLRTGVTLVGSEVHPVKTRRGWVQMKDLTTDDEVALSFGANTWGTAECDEREAVLLGLMVGDGCYTRPYGVVKFSTGDPGLVDYYRSLCAEFGIRTRNFVKGPNNNSVEWCNQAFKTSLIERYGLKVTTAHHKTIPTRILQAPLPTICKFLSGLFETDGSVSFEKTKSGKVPIISFTTTSQELATQVQAIFHNAGVPCTSVRLKVPKFGSRTEFYDHEVYCLRIKQKTGVAWFAENVGFLSPRKKAKLAEVLKHMALEPGGRVTCWKVQDGFVWLPVKRIEQYEVRPLYDLHVPGSHSFVSNGVVSHNSGKSVLTGVMASYLEHELAHIGDIHDYFEVLPGDPLQISFIATTAKQSEETAYVKFRALRERSPWMTRYVGWVKNREKHQVVSPGKKKWGYSEETDTEVYNGLLDLSLRALHSNSSGLAGATRVGVFMDEMSRLDSSESARSGSEVVKVMMQGLKTVRGARDRKKLRPFWGLFAAVTSPISIDDHGMTMMRQGRTFAVGSISGPGSNSVPGTFSFHYPTWEFNPDLPRSTFDSDFIRDSVGATRDFGAQPPTAASPYVDDEARFRSAIDYSLKPTVTFRAIEPVDKTGRLYTGAQVVHAEFDPIHTHYLHFDAGVSFDTFAGCSAHGEWVPIKDPQTGAESRRLITVVDWVLGMRPIIGKTQAEKRTVWFDCVVEILKALQKSSRIALVTFDRWNSEKLIQDIRNLGIPTENRSLAVPQFMDFLRAAYEGDVRLLPPRKDEPDDPRLKNDAEKAVYELLRLERTPDLKRIFNPKKGQVQGMNSDDLAQVVVGAHVNVQGSVVAVSDSQSIKEVLRRENAGGAAYYGQNADGESGGRITRGRRF